MNTTKTQNTLKLSGFCALLGLVAVIILWLFLKIMTSGMTLLWDTLPNRLGVSWYPVIICTIGGLITGLFRKKFGDYPEELEVVMGKIKTEKNYQYKNMGVMILGALLPLLAGGCIGPEAGMTGIIAGLCYWVGNNVKFAKIHSKEYTEIGTAVTLGILFHSPLFGIFAVEEDPNETVPSITKGNKIFLYGLAIAGGTAGYMVLNRLFGAPMSGFPSLENTVELATKDYMMIIVYILAGALLALLYQLSHKITVKLGQIIPPVISETIAGLSLGLVALVVPAVLFSGEEEMTHIMETYSCYMPWMLLLISVLKIILTNVCINLGLKGGHFFPLIFAGLCGGFAIAMFAGCDIVLGATVVTAALLGSIMKKPIAVTMLLFICFPVKMFVWIFVAAVVGSKIFGRVSRQATV